MKHERLLPKLGPRGWLAVAVAPAFLLALLFVFGVIGKEVMGFLYLVWFFVGVGPLTRQSWRALDEPSREAHKTAAVAGFGSGIGIGLVIVFLFLYFQNAADLIHDWLDNLITSLTRLVVMPPIRAGYLLGILSIVLLQVVVYGIVWLFWWAQRRHAETD